MTHQRSARRVALHPRGTTPTALAVWQVQEALWELADAPYLDSHEVAHRVAEVIWAEAFEAGVTYTTGLNLDEFFPHYLSTACFHGEHGYCKTKYGMNGLKKPATCKFCEARCQCECHGSPEPA